MENTIIVKGGAYREVKRALQAWINLYADDLLKDICFEMYRNGRGNHVIKADPRLENIQFFYLLNYLTYPMNIEYKAEVTGYTCGDDNSQWPGQKLMVYISETDTDHDNVFLLTKENKAYKVPFGFGKEIEEVAASGRYQAPKLSNLILPDVLSIQSEEIRNLEKPTPVEVGKRRLDIGMKISAFILAIIFFLGYVISDQELYAEVVMIGLLVPIFLFLLFHELLRYKEIFLRMLVFALAVAGYAYFLHLWFQFNLSEIIFFWGLNSLSFLLIQWPLRKLFLLIFKRESDIDRTGKISDMFYSMILYTSFIWPLLLFSEIVN